MKIPINKIKPDPNQPRKTFEDIDELAQAIKEEGMLQPLLLDKNYKLIDGERRFRAAQNIGLKEVPVIVLNFNVGDETKRMVWQLMIDIHNHKLPIIERDQAYLKLWEEMGKPAYKVISKVVKKSEQIVGDALERARFVPKIHHDGEKITARVVTQTKGIKDRELREKVINKITKEGGGSGGERADILINRIREADGDVEKQDEILAEPVTNYTKEADMVIFAIKTILKYLHKGLMLKIPKTQAVILSGYIVELQKHLKTWDAEEAEIIEN